jgi:hypothetical protein
MLQRRLSVMWQWIDYLETQSSMFTTNSTATLIKENTRHLKWWDLNLVSNSANTRYNKLLLFMTLYPSTLLSFLVAFSILGNLTPYVFISHFVYEKSNGHQPRPVHSPVVLMGPPCRRIGRILHLTTKQVAYSARHVYANTAKTLNQKTKKYL